MNPDVCTDKGQRKVTNFSLVNAVYVRGIGKMFDLNATALLVLIGLINHFNPDKAIVFPSQEYLAEHLNVSERSVIRAIKDLLLKNLIIKSKKGASNVYCFTNVFFESVKMSGDRCQNVTDKGAKMAGKHDNNKYINNVFELKIGGYPGIEATKRLIDEKKEMDLGSPLDYGYEEAKEFLSDLIPELQNSYFAKELRKKWNL